MVLELLELKGKVAHIADLKSISQIGSLRNILNMFKTEKKNKVTNSKLKMKDNSLFVVLSNSISSRMINIDQKDKLSMNSRIKKNGVLKKFYRPAWSTE